ncbi:MAG: GxxExxY protein [Akkermansiaceae bacterium]
MPDNDLTYQVIGAAMHVHNELGPGLREKPYENALRIALKKLNMHVDQQRAYPISYEGHIVGDCLTDLVVNNELIIETKSIDSIGDNEIAQLLNYLRVSGLKLGLLLNFKPSKLEVKRVIR